jgi:maltose alpha-D-glucosyltransferase / alpha-amylase
MLLAEANQLPAQVSAYFGDSDECHMAYHFPLMPRLFIGIHQENREPIADALAQTPVIPETCQWALFLRNHDELTLEMVTDEERDYMYLAYTADPEARLNLGIRRRLAPLLGNDRRRIELMTALLFSLPGTPIIYYGDEIGMGDNILLGDRHGVRTPMQWSAAENAGFSTAPGRLFSPVIDRPGVLVPGGQRRGPAARMRPHCSPGCGTWWHSASCFTSSAAAASNSWSRTTAKS